MALVASFRNLLQSSTQSTCSFPFVIVLLVERRRCPSCFVVDVFAACTRTLLPPHSLWVWTIFLAFDRYVNMRFICLCTAIYTLSARPALFDLELDQIKSPIRYKRSHSSAKRKHHRIDGLALECFALLSCQLLVLEHHSFRGGVGGYRVTCSSDQNLFICFTPINKLARMVADSCGGTFATHPRGWNFAFWWPQSCCCFAFPRIAIIIISCLGVTRYWLQKKNKEDPYTTPRTGACSEIAQIRFRYRTHAYSASTRENNPSTHDAPTLVLPYRSFITLIEPAFRWQLDHGDGILWGVRVIAACPLCTRLSEQADFYCYRVTSSSAHPRKGFLPGVTRCHGASIIVSLARFFLYGFACS